MTTGNLGTDHFISRAEGAGIFPRNKLFFFSLFAQQVIFQKQTATSFLFEFNIGHCLIKVKVTG